VKSLDQSVTEDFCLAVPGGQVVRGVIRLPTEPRAAQAALVFVHGFGSDRRGEKASVFERESVRRGWIFAGFDFRGHGESDGTLLELRGSRLLEDLEAVCSAVAERGRCRLMLAGSSMGGWAAAWFAARNPERVAACALVAPAFGFAEWRGITSAERRRWRETGRLKVHNGLVDAEIGYGLTEEASRFHPVLLYRLFRTPAIVFHGVQDDVVPYTETLTFAERCAAADLELVILKSGDHRLSLFKEQLCRRSCDFFARHVGKEPGRPETGAEGGT